MPDDKLSRGGSAPPKNCLACETKMATAFARPQARFAPFFYPQLYPSLRCAARFFAVILTYLPRVL